VPTVVAVFLPLSGMWASAHTTNSNIACSSGMAAVGIKNSHAVPVGGSDLTSAKAYGSTKGSGTDSGFTADSTLYDDEASLAPNHRHRENPEMQQLHGDVEMQRFKDRSGVVVDRTYSVRSG
jgi:hypothetical protein